MNRKTIITLLLLLPLLAGAPALAGQSPLPQPRTLWISGDPADLAPLAGQIWEFTSYLDGTDPAVETIIFTDSIKVNNTGAAILGTMYPTCEPWPGPDGPIYESCGGTMYVQFTQAQKDVFDNLEDFGFGSILYLQGAPGFISYWFNIYENGLDEPALAVGYVEMVLDGIVFPPTWLEGRRVFPGDEAPPEDGGPGDSEPEE